jgi:kinesin family protein 13
MSGFLSSRKLSECSSLVPSLFFVGIFCSVVIESQRFSFLLFQEFKVYVTEEFVEHCAEGALSIEVWGHRSTGFDFNQGWEMENVQAKSRSLLDR